VSILGIVKENTFAQKISIRFYPQKNPVSLDLQGSL